MVSILMYLKRKKVCLLFYFFLLCFSPPPLQSLWWILELFTSALPPSCCFCVGLGEGLGLTCVGSCGLSLWHRPWWADLVDGQLQVVVNSLRPSKCSNLTFLFVVGELRGKLNLENRDIIFRHSYTTNRMEGCSERDTLSVPFCFFRVLNVNMRKGLPF